MKQPLAAVVTHAAPHSVLARGFFPSRFAPGLSMMGLLLMGLLASMAQAAPNFSGEWKMNASKSDFGPAAATAPEILTRSIKHNDPMLEIATYQKGAQGEVKAQLKYTTDGKECVNQLPGGAAKGTAKWQGDHLLIESTRTSQGVEIKQADTWTLSGGGKVLTVVSHVTIPQGAFDLKYVFEKQ